MNLYLSYIYWQLGVKNNQPKLSFPGKIPPQKNPTQETLAPAGFEFNEKSEKAMLIGERELAKCNLLLIYNFLQTKILKLPLKKEKNIEVAFVYVFFRQ